jgi:hypothetical protein
LAAATATFGLSRLAATAVSFCGNGGSESVFIWTLGPKETDADAPDIACFAARAAIAGAEIMARAPFEIPPG